MFETILSHIQASSSKGGIVSRAFAPLALGTAATCYFYPKTTLNIIRSNPQGLELSNQVSSATSDLQEWIHDSRARLQTLASTDPSILASTMYQKIKDKINSANSSEKKD